MYINIIESKDTKVLALLNRDVQSLHNDIEPDIFQPYDGANVLVLFEEIFRSNPEAYSYIAYCNEVPAGYVLFSMRQNPPSLFKKAYSLVYIEQMCVDAEYREMGIGMKLLEKVKDFARQHNIHRLELDCWTKNVQGNLYFEAQGFQNYNSRKYMTI